MTTLSVIALHRDHDVSGVSGTGVVADGVIFPDGVVVIRWRGRLQSTAVYPGIGTLRAVHGHNGATRIVTVAQFPVDEGWSHGAHD